MIYKILFFDNDGHEEKKFRNYPETLGSNLSQELKKQKSGTGVLGIVHWSF